MTKMCFKTTLSRTKHWLHKNTLTWWNTTVRGKSIISLFRYLSSDRSLLE